MPGSYALGSYLSDLRGVSSVGVVVHGASRIGDVHLVDTLLALGVRVRRIFVPEHGFLSRYRAGEVVPDTVYRGISVVSLYGRNRTFPDSLLADIELLVIDLQDVGVRAYTYISTMYYALRAAGRRGVPVIVLDRPNPNVGLVDGPLVDSSFQSFVAVVPIPFVYGLTIGELACVMVRAWIDTPPELKVIPCMGECEDWGREGCPRDNPSPALRTCLAIRLYPILVFLEGTAINPCRETDQPFTCVCMPGEGVGKECWHVERSWGRYRRGRCCGYGLDGIPDSVVGRWDRLPWYWLFVWWVWQGEKPFYSYFDRLAGTERLRMLVEVGAPLETYWLAWEEDLKAFWRLVPRECLLYLRREKR